MRGGAGTAGAGGGGGGGSSTGGGGGGGAADVCARSRKPPASVLISDSGGSAAAACRSGSFRTWMTCWKPCSASFHSLRSNAAFADAYFACTIVGSMRFLTSVNAESRRGDTSEDEGLNEGSA